MISLVIQQTFASDDIATAFDERVKMAQSRANSIAINKDIQLAKKALILWKTEVSEGDDRSEYHISRTVPVVTELIRILENPAVESNKSGVSFMANTSHVITVSNTTFVGSQYKVIFPFDNLYCSSNIEMFREYVENNNFFYTSYYSTVHKWHGYWQTISRRGKTVSISISCLDEAGLSQGGMSENYIFHGDELFSKAR